MNDGKLSSQLRMSPGPLQHLMIWSVALIVCSLQIGLPLFSIWRMKSALEQSGGIIESRTFGFQNDLKRFEPWRFWNRRFRFLQFLNPILNADRPFQHLLSACVIRDELTLLVVDNSYYLGRNAGSALSVIRVDLKSGQVTRSVAPKNSRYVIADQQSVRFVPHYGEFQKKKVERSPFMLNGRPVAVVTYQENPNLFQLIEYVDDKWRATDQLVLLPGRFSQVYCFPVGGVDHLVAFDVGRERIQYRTGVSLGSEQQAVEFDEKYASTAEPLEEKILQEIGWKQFRVPKSISLSYFEQTWDMLGIRFAQDSPQLLLGSDKAGNSTNLFARLFWYDCDSESENVDQNPRYSRSQLTYLNRLHNQIYERPTACVDSMDGSNYLATLRYYDGELCVWKWKENGFQKIVWLRGPLIWFICLDGALLFLLAVALPTLFLVLLACAIERKQLSRPFEFGHRSARLASTFRRGMARVIDLYVTVIPFLISIVLHPEASQWWIMVCSPVQNNFSSGVIPWTDWARRQLTIWNAIREQFFSFPFVWWILVLALLATFIQIIWQARSGKTIGKWICGIEVVRTTFRPCGFTRSLLREILLVVDSLFLLCWVPGVTAMLSTSLHQRLGDYFSDTIVVRSNPPQRLR